MIGDSIVSSSEDGLAKLAKHARGVLVLLAALQLVGGAIFYVAGGFPDMASLATTLGLGVIFVILALWAAKDPLMAVLVGLGIWASVMVVEAIIEPASLMRGVVLKILVIVMFANGISTGRTYNKLKLMLGGKS